MSSFRWRTITHPHFRLTRQLTRFGIQDCTGSQGSYISSATKNIEEICANIFASGKLVHQEDLRVGLVAFRDHPPQDHTYVTKTNPFTSDIKQVHQVLTTLYASGGGDGPEAVTAALGEALNMDWRENASKMVVLIADAPPHGIGEYGDGVWAIVFLAIALTPLQVSMMVLLMVWTPCKSSDRWHNVVSHWCVVMLRLHRHSDSLSSFLSRANLRSVAIQ